MKGKRRRPAERRLFRIAAAGLLLFSGGSSSSSTAAPGPSLLLYGEEAAAWARERKEDGDTTTTKAPRRTVRVSVENANPPEAGAGALSVQFVPPIRSRGESFAVKPGHMMTVTLEVGHYVVIVDSATEEAVAVYRASGEGGGTHQKKSENIIVGGGVACKPMPEPVVFEEPLSIEEEEARIAAESVYMRRGEGCTCLIHG